MNHDPVLADLAPRRRATDSIFERVAEMVGKVGVAAALAGAMVWFSAVEVRGLRDAVMQQTEKLGQIVEILRDRK